jgi:hypothetical protein
VRRFAVSIGVALAAISGGVGALAASASAEEAVTIPGNPLTVFVGPLGQCQSAYAEKGNNFYPPFGSLGDCGFFLAFPKESAPKFKGQPAALAGTTWGFPGTAGPHIPEPGGKEYEAGTQSPVSGAGTEASPLTQTTTYFVNPVPGNPGSRLVEIVETTTYVNGQPQFTSMFKVRSLTLEKMYFRAIYAGDLYMLGNDFGTGVFLGGPPRFVGGQNPESGLLGGFQEVPGSPWTAFQEGCWNETPEFRCEGAAGSDAGIWHIVRTSVEAETAFNNTVDPAYIDNGAGVEWDQLREAGLEGNGESSFSVVSRTQIPSALKVSPTNQTLTQGQTETLNVSATDLSGTPYAGKVVYYTVAGANPSSGSVTLNSAGAAQVSYVGHNPGLDTIQVFVDLVGNGVKASGDPSGTAQVTFLPLPPTPNSSYKVQSVKANSNGTITITFVPVQGGTATLEVTVPTGTIARRLALAAKSKKCKKGQVKIKGKCRPKTTVSGKISATGVAGVPLTLTVKPSGKVTAALKKGRTVVLTATLTYKSSLGGTPSVTTYHFTIKPPKHKKHH